MSEQEIEELKMSTNYIKDLYHLFTDPLVLKTLQLSQGETALLQLVWIEQKSFAEIAPQFNVADDRIGQMYHSTVVRLKRNIIATCRQSNAMETTLARIENLERENKELKRKLNSLPDDKTTLLAGNIDILKTPVAKLNLSLRTLKALNLLKIDTLGDLTEWSKTDLLRVKNFGNKSLRLLEETLAKYQVKLKD